MRTQTHKLIVKDGVQYHLTTERENNKITGYVLKVKLPQAINNVWSFLGIGELK